MLGSLGLHMMIFISVIFSLMTLPIYGANLVDFRLYFRVEAADCRHSRQYMCACETHLTWNAHSVGYIMSI